VDLCGHATLAAAWSLLDQGQVSATDRISFHSRKSGILTAQFQTDGKDTKVILDFPADPVAIDQNVPEYRANAVAHALSGKSSMTARELGIVEIGRGRFDLFVVLKDDKVLRQLAPDFAFMKTIPARGVTVTARSSDGASDFVSRFFAPQSGIDEDPVTGSAHCTLFTYWWPQIEPKRADGSLRAYQASKRGGLLDGRLVGDRVTLAGLCVPVWRGKLSDSALANHRAKL